MSDPRGFATVRRWTAANRTVLGNASALAGSTLATSLLGFAFWSVAARLAPPSAVGLASAAVSSMMLIGTVGMMGLGTLMIGELPRRRDGRGPLLATALGAAAVASLLLWAGVVAVGPRVGGGDLVALLLWPPSALGVVLVATGQVLDQALVGLLRGGLQLWRNVAFATAKLAVLGVLLAIVGARGPQAMVASWVIGLVASLVLVAALLARAGTRFVHRPSPRLLRRLGGAGLKHHALNLALEGPRLVLPVLAIVLVAADAAAAFYVAWMIASFAFVVPGHFATVLHAVGSADRARLAERLRFSLRVSLALGLAATAVLLASAPFVLRLFSPYYETHATGSLRILALVVPAMTLKLHVVAVGRVRDRVGRTALLMGGGALLEVGLAALGAARGGIAGLAVGFVAAVVVQAVASLPALLDTLRSRPAA